MKAVVLAAGKGTRLRPLTEDKPEGMVEVAGKPLLSHYFEQLIDLDFDEVLETQAKEHADAAFLVEKVPWEEASRYGVCNTNESGKITEVVEKPDDPLRISS